MKRSKRYFCFNDNEVFIKPRFSGIESLRALLDGIKMVTWGESQEVGYPVEDVMEWHKNEIQHFPNRNRNRECKMLIKILEKVNSNYEENKDYLLSDDYDPQNSILNNGLKEIQEEYKNTNKNLIKQKKG